MDDADRPAPAERLSGVGGVRGNISRRIVQLHKEFYGKGPTQAKTYYHDDVVVVVMSGGFTRVEETLLREGRGDSVIQQRKDFQEVMVARFSAGDRGGDRQKRRRGDEQQPSTPGPARRDFRARRRRRAETAIDCRT
jgi:Na+-translocating membrane potential-generating system (MpsC)